MEEYDVAISYASADFEVAGALALRLTAQGFRVFFDRQRAETLWGERLAEVLTDIYAHRARVVVVLVSRHYGSSPWTMLERNAARTRLRDRDSAGSVLPLCLDDTEPVGLETLGRQYLRPGEDPSAIDKLVARIVMARTLAQPGDPPMTNSGKSRDHLSNQPSLAVHGGQGGGAVHARVTSKTSVGLGAFGMTGLLVVVIAALTGVGWLAFEEIRNLPRDDQGRVTVLGVPVPFPAMNDDETRLEDERDRATATGSVLPAAASISPTPTPTRPAAPFAEATTIHGRLEGLWSCWGGGHSVHVTFTETRLATLVDVQDADGTRYRETPFATWTTVAYEVISAKTMRVGDKDTHFELDDRGNSLRLIGGRIVFNCNKQRI